MNDEKCTCGNCGHAATADAVSLFEHDAPLDCLSDSAGGTIPAGACPVCGSFMYLDAAPSWSVEGRLARHAGDMAELLAAVLAVPGAAVDLARTEFWPGVSLHRRIVDLLAGRESLPYPHC